MKYGYARVSTDDQDPAVQEQQLRELIAQRGWTLQRIYSDRSSGAKERRPGLDTLMVDARRGAFDVVVVWRFDRFARSVRQLVMAWDEFHSLGIDFMSHQEAPDTSTPMGRAMFAIIGAKAELERNVIRAQASNTLGSTVRNREIPLGDRVQYFRMTKCFNCMAKVSPDGKSLAGWAWGRGRSAES